MSTLESISLDTLSDGDAVSLLFELAGGGEPARDKLMQLDALVYARLLQAYDADEQPVLRACPA